MDTTSTLLIVGGGLAGAKAAEGAREGGFEGRVVLIEELPVPLHRVLGSDVGGMFTQLHLDHGVAMRLGVGVEKLQGGSAVEQVVLADGRVEAADVVVVGIGVMPRIGLAEAAGL